MQKNNINNRPTWADRVAKYNVVPETFDAEGAWNRISQRFEQKPLKATNKIKSIGGIIVALVAITAITIVADKVVKPYKKRIVISDNDTLLFENHSIYKLTNNYKTRTYLCDKDSLRKTLLDEKQNSSDTSFTNNNPKIVYFDSTKLVWKEIWDHGHPLTNGPIIFVRVAGEDKELTEEEKEALIPPSRRKHKE